MLLSEAALEDEDVARQVVQARDWEAARQLDIRKIFEDM